MSPTPLQIPHFTATQEVLFILVLVVEYLAVIGAFYLFYLAISSIRNWARARVNTVWKRVAYFVLLFSYYYASLWLIFHAMDYIHTNLVLPLFF